MSIEDVTRVHVTKAFTLKNLMDLIDEYPNLNTITCSKSIYDRTPSRYFEALQSVDIKVEIEYKWGENRKYTEEEINRVLNLLNKGNSPKNISELLDIPLERVYYFRSKYSNNDKNDYYYNRKYDDETYDEIFKLKSENYKAKEISEKLNIPLRTVYYILNKK